MPIEFRPLSATIFDNRFGSAASQSPQRRVAPHRIVLLESLQRTAIYFRHAHMRASPHGFRNNSSRKSSPQAKEVEGRLHHVPIQGLHRPLPVRSRGPMHSTTSQSSVRYREKEPSCPSN